MRHVLILLLLSFNVNGMMVSSKTEKSACAGKSGNTTITLTINNDNHQTDAAPSGCGCKKCFTTLAKGASALLRLIP